MVQRESGSSRARLFKRRMVAYATMVVYATKYRFKRFGTEIVFCQADEPGPTAPSRQMTHLATGEKR
jgi:hypothetical protein